MQALRISIAVMNYLKPLLYLKEELAIVKKNLSQVSIIFSGFSVLAPVRLTVPFCNMAHGLI